MEEKKDIATQISEICQFANLATQEDRYQTAYPQYTHAFEALLRPLVSNRDATNQEHIRELVNVVYMVYDDMLDTPEQMTLQTEKLIQYINSLVTQLQQDPNYLRHWSLQDTIDALLQTDRLESGPEISTQPIEDLIESNMKELDAILAMDYQKSELLTENDVDDQDPDEPFDQAELEQAMSKLFQDLDTHAAKSHALHETTDSETASLSTHVPKYSFDDGDSLSTKSDDFEVSSEFSDTSSQATEEETAYNLEFSKQFHLLITKFQDQPIAKPLQGQDRIDLETTTDHITRNILDLYKTCFKQGVTEENLSQFEQGAQSIINNWSYWSEQDLSATSAPLIAQSFAKLTMNLLKLTEDTRRDLPSASSPRSFKD